jgi:hypothetical protein
VDVRDLRISPLSQEVPVWPPGLFGSLFGFLVFFLIVLAFPYFSVTPVRCVSSSLFLRFWPLDAACDGAYESMHWATHAVGSWDLVDNARSLLVSFRVGGQGPWLS